MSERYSCVDVDQDIDAVFEVSIESIRSANSIRVRQEDIDHTKVLAETAASLPPILVHRNSMQVIDGNHRLQAAKSRNAETICVRFFDGSEEEAFVLAVEANNSHGLPLSLADRKSASRRIIAQYPQWSDRKIAEITGLAHKTVGAARRRSSGEIPQTTTRLGRDGRTRRLRDNGPERGRLEVAENSSASDGSAARSASSGQARDREPIARNRKPDDPADHTMAAGARAFNSATALHNLRTDPSLRFTESGRAMLRWLDAAPRTAEESATLADRIPDHCVGAVIAIARYNAAIWNNFANRLCGRLQAAQSSQATQSSAG